MRPALATVCSLPSPLATIVEDYAAGHCDAIDLWLGHADGFLESHDPAALRDLLARHGMAAVAASFQGGLLTSQGDARREHWKHFESRLDLLRAERDAVVTQPCVQRIDEFPHAAFGRDDAAMARPFRSVEPPGP